MDEDYLVDFMMLLWWHPESEVVITMEDMPIELEPTLPIHERVPRYLQKFWRENHSWES